MRAAAFILTFLVALCLLGTAVFSEPEKLTDNQMTDVNVQKGIKTLNNSETTEAEEKILEEMATPLPGTALDTTNTNPVHNMTQVELDNLDNQQNQQNVQEQFSEQLFDNVLDSNN